MNKKHVALGIILVGAAFGAARAFASRRDDYTDAGASLGDLFAFPDLAGYTLGFDAFNGAVGEGSSPVSQADSNVRAFLDMIAAAEGADYNVRFGGATFDDFTDHPRIRTPFTQTDGKRNYSTAAGRYQFLQGTWDKLKKDLGLVDFSPESQDAAALELIRRQGALDDVVAGNFESAVRKVRTIWASLPGSPYPQRTRSWEFVQRAYQGAGGAIT